MEFILTGASASGIEFERLGVVSKVFPRQEVIPAAMNLAERIAAMSRPVVATAKRAVLMGTSPPPRFMFGPREMTR
jgi:enoyl-CoA hydratase